MERQESKRFSDGREKLFEGKDGGNASKDTAQPLFPGSPAAGCGGLGSPPGGRPAQGAAWGKLGGRIVISVGVLLNYTTSYLSPGGAAGGQTDGWTDTQGPGGPGRPPL